MFIKKCFISVFLAAVFSLPARAEDFIRIQEDQDSVRLETSITRYSKGNARVDLIGAIHIADSAYYQALTTRFTTYDFLLFEMVGGEAFPKNATPQAVPAKPAAGAEKKQKLVGLNELYDSAARFLKLTPQMTSIDYTTKNFVHADLTAAEFQQKQTERHESLFSFMLKISLLKEPTNQANPLKLIYALAARNPNLIKRELVKNLGHGEDQISALAGDSVVITDRNVRCLEVMHRELELGHKNLGIFYGAAHFKDMEKRLLEKGFRPGNPEWLTAWNIPKLIEKPLDAAQKPVDLCPP
jgi:hypothetical protein